MLEKLKRTLEQMLGGGDRADNPDAPDDRDAGKLAPVKRGPPDRGSSVAVAEPDEDE